jgi:hypothetical protein
MDALQPVPEVDIFNQADPRALINLVPEAVQNAFRMALSKRPELIGMDEKGLYRLLRSENEQPSTTDNRIRLRFWMEYDSAQADQREMQMSYAHGGICSKEFFYQKYISHTPKIAWLLCRPASYEAISTEALHFGLEQLRDILDVPHVLPNGKPDTKLMEIKAKIVNMLDQRVRGSVIQKTMNLNLTTSEKKVSEVAEISSMQELERRLVELKRRERKAQNIIETSAVSIEQADT